MVGSGTVLARSGRYQAYPPDKSQGMVTCGVGVRCRGTRLRVSLQVIGLVVDLATGWAVGAMRDRVPRRSAATLVLDVLAGLVYLTPVLLLVVETITG